ncbi:MAG: hypothetical protein WCL39_08520 [Armatimonadota bacterium]
MSNNPAAPEHCQAGSTVPCIVFAVETAPYALWMFGCRNFAPGGKKRFIEQGCALIISAGELRLNESHEIELRLFGLLNTYNLLAVRFAEQAVANLVDTAERVLLTKRNDPRTTQLAEARAAGFVAMQSGLEQIYLGDGTTLRQTKWLSDAGAGSDLALLTTLTQEPFLEREVINAAMAGRDPQAIFQRFWELLIDDPDVALSWLRGYHMHVTLGGQEDSDIAINLATELPPNVLDTFLSISRSLSLSLVQAPSITEIVSEGFIDIEFRWRRLPALWQILNPGMANLA